MKRKVNKVGQNTLTVSLPSKWAKDHSVNSGDEIELDEKGNTLTISKSRISEKREITIEIDSESKFLRRLLVMPYIRGYDIIKVRYSDPKVYFLVQKTMNSLLLGFEIMDYSKNQCILKNIAEGLDSEFDSNFRRYFLQVRSILESLKTAVEKKDMNEIDNILILDEAIDKFNLFLRRVINIRGYSDNNQITKMYYTINLLETVSDHCKEICTRIVATKKFPTLVFVDFMKKIIKFTDLYYEMFYKFEVEKMVQFKNLDNEIRPNLVKEIDKGKDAFFYAHLLDIDKMIRDLSEELNG